MASIVVPGLDLAPSVPSRIVTVDVIDMTEGAPAAGAKVDFILPQDLHARSDGKVLKAGTTTLELDANGHGEIRVPAYSAATRPEDWVLLVKKEWAPYPYPIRVPTGTGKISLATLTPPEEVSDAMSKYVVTEVTASVGAPTAGGSIATVNVAGGIADFTFRFPDMATLETAMPKTRGVIAEATDLNLLRDLADVGSFSARAEYLENGPPITGNPVVTVETLRNTSNAVVQRLSVWSGEMWWRIATGNTTWSGWMRLSNAPKVSDDPTTPLSDGETLYLVDTGHAATVFPTADGMTEAWDAATWNWRPRDTGRGQWYSLTMNNRGSVLWDRYPTVGNADVTMVVEPTDVSTSQYGAGIIMRATEAGSLRNGVVIGIDQQDSIPKLRVFQSLNSVMSTLSQQPYAWEVGEELVLRARMIGNLVQAKVWQVGEAEPSDWLISASSGVTEPGGVGAYARGVHMRVNMLEVQVL